MQENCFKAKMFDAVLQEDFFRVAALELGFVGALGSQGAQPRIQQYSSQNRS